MSKHLLRLLPCVFCLPCDEEWISLSQELCLHLLHIITWIRDIIFHCHSFLSSCLTILFLFQQHFPHWLMQALALQVSLNFMFFYVVVHAGWSVSKSLKTAFCDRHSDALRDRNPVRVKTFWCVLIAVGVSYVSHSTPDATVGVSN